MTVVPREPYFETVEYVSAGGDRDPTDRLTAGSAAGCPFSFQTCPSAVVNSQKLLDTAPERKKTTQDASSHIQAASGPVATVLAGARGQKRVANYDEIGHRTGPRKKRTLYIADAKQATGQLITEIQIGQRMLGIIESSARYAQAMEAAARQRQQSYDDG